MPFENGDRQDRTKDIFPTAMAALSKLSRYRKSEGGTHSPAERETERERGRVDFRSGRDPQIRAVQSKLI